jgi:hypothetical protein
MSESREQRQPDRPAGAEQPLAGGRKYPERSPGRGGRFVVLHAGVDGFTRGQVVHAGDFAEGVDFDRLRSLGAVREAHESEHKFATVPIGPDEAARAADIVRLRDECDRQKQQIEAMQERFRLHTEFQHKQAPGPGGPHPYEAPAVSPRPEAPEGRASDVTLMELQSEHQRQQATLGALTDKMRALDALAAGRPGAPPPAEGPPAPGAGPTPAGPDGPPAAEAQRAERQRAEAAERQRQEQVRQQQQAQAQEQRGKGK